MKLWKKLACLSLTAVIALAQVPVTALADGGLKFTKKEVTVTGDTDLSTYLNKTGDFEKSEVYWGGY